MDLCSESFKSEANSLTFAGVEVVLSGLPSSFSSSCRFFVAGGPFKYSLLCKVLNNESIKGVVLSCKKTSICCSILSRSSDSGLSFLTRARTYLDNAAGSASHLEGEKIEVKIKNGRNKNCLQRLEDGRKPQHKRIRVIDVHFEAKMQFNRYSNSQLFKITTNKYG